MYLFIVNLLQPFTLLFLMAAITLANLWRKDWEMRRRLLWLTIPFILLALFCTPAMAFLAARMFERHYPPLPERPDHAEAIVVLSGGVCPPNKNQKQSRPSYRTLLRCLRAAELYRQGIPCPVVVSGGKVDLSRPGKPDAHIMRDFLIQMGIMETDLIVEDRSMDTYENAVESRRLLEHRGIDNIVLVTDAIHLYRAGLCFSKLGLTVTPAGCNYLASEFQIHLFQFLPRIEGAGKNQVVFHEVLGLIWFWFRSRI